MSSLPGFIKLFQHVFDHSPNAKETGERLLNDALENQPVSKCMLKFQTIAARSDTALQAAFPQGLNVLTELAYTDEQLSLDCLLDLTIQLDQLLMKHPQSLP